MQGTQLLFVANFYFLHVSQGEIDHFQVDEDIIWRG